MKTHIAFLSALLAMPLVVAAANAVAAPDADAPAVTSAATVGPGPWLVRAEGSLVDMRDNWLNIPGPEVGLTVGRDLASRLSLELTGSARKPDSNQPFVVRAGGRPGCHRRKPHRPACADGRGRAIFRARPPRSWIDAFRPCGAGLCVPVFVRLDGARRRGREHRARDLALRRTAAGLVPGQRRRLRLVHRPRSRRAGDPRGRQDRPRAIGRRLAVLTPEGRRKSRLESRRPRS